MMEMKQVLQGFRAIGFMWDHNHENVDVTDGFITFYEVQERFFYGMRWQDQSQ